MPASANAIAEIPWTRSKRGSGWSERRPVTLPAGAQPILFVVVDTEEEFNWRAPLSRKNVDVRAIRQLHRAHTLLGRYDVKPTYVVDFPVASRPDGYLPMRELAESGDCSIGAHLHPWVNPPLTETVSRHNSYACNLPPDLEFEKLAVLKDAIGSHIGVDARIYKAGRYGLGPSSLPNLDELGFDIDMSVNPRMDYSHDGGPSFEAFDATPFFFGGRRPLLEIPCSVGFAGVAGSWAPSLHRVASSRLCDRARLPGVMSRLGIVDKIMLSPETSTFAELRRVTRALMRQGVRTFTLSFHSPSLVPGCTPYVRNQRDLSDFLAKVESYCEFFFGELGGITKTPQQFKGTVTP